jgi:hypothetical protein
MCTNRCRTKNKLSQLEPNKLSYEEIIKGTGYKTINPQEQQKDGKRQAAHL